MTARKWFRNLLKALASICACLLIAAAVTLFILQTTWFKGQVRERIVAAVQDSTGGHVELGSFSYNWQTLTASFRQFVIHGTEPLSGPPLFRASDIDVRLRILSVFERKVAVSSIVVDRPEVYILVRDDGSANIPAPEMRQQSPQQTMQQLLNLRLRHFELRNGTLRTTLQQIPLNARADDTYLLLTYNRSAPSYLAKLTASRFYLNAESFQAIGMTVKAQARLEKNRITLESSEVASGNSQIHSTGSLRQFNRPVLDLQVNADLAGADVARIADIPQLRGGRVRFVGAIHRDTITPFAITGSIAGQQLGLQSTGFSLTNSELRGQITASTDRFALSNFTLRVPWGELSGNAALLHNRDFSLAGHVAGVNVVEAERILFHNALPWQAVAAGTLDISGGVGHSFRNFAVNTKLDINPSAGAPPASGHLEASYHQLGDTLDLANSQVNLPHTRLSIAGRVNDRLRAVLDSTDLDDFHPLQQLAGNRVAALHLPHLSPNGNAHFDGDIIGPPDRAHISGNVLLTHFNALNEDWDSLRAQADLSSGSATLTGLSVDQGPLHASGTVHLQLANWSLNPNAPASLQLQFRGASIVRAASLAHLGNLPIRGGPLSGSLNLHGSMNNPQGTAQLRAQHLEIFDQPLGQAAADLQVHPRDIRIANGRLQTGSASLNFSGDFAHQPASWTTGQLHIKADSNAFPLTALAVARQNEPAWNAQLEIHGDAGIKIDNGHIEPTVANGKLFLRHVTQNHEVLGDVTLDASTKGDVLYAGFAGNLRETQLKGNAEIHLIPGSPVKGQIQVDRIALKTLYALWNGSAGASPPLDGFLRGTATFDGPLAQPQRMQGSIRIDDVQVSAASLLQTARTDTSQVLVFRNSAPIVFDAADGSLTVRSFRLTGRDTNFALTGSLSYFPKISFNLDLGGALDLRFFQLFQPGLQTSGRGLLAASLTGNPAAPILKGTLQIQNGALFANGLPNGLTEVNGSIQLDRGRATIEKLTAQTGGGTLSAGGFIDFSTGGPLIYRLDARAENVRVRYANSISLTASSQLRLTGNSRNSVLSGSATVSRVVFTPNADVGTLLAFAAASSAAGTRQNDFLTGLQLDVQIESAPDLQVTTELSRDVQAEIDLRLRGTPGHPVLLGDIVANQGDIKVFGGNYSINRGEIRFINAARIEPVLDLDLQTVARGITVDIT
ncbi:MAG: translocation/assembly module TamB domain-containing protein, partial [Acidobacteriaceae bacterium]|nr:translocation/assembly module TamB domain-containing protein [Acidobacteriaceae bacterium]